MAAILLAPAFLLGLALLPFGLPGLWLMAGSALVYLWVAPHPAFGYGTVGLLALAALASELLDLAIAARYTRKYGGSRRAGWGAILGGIAGAVIGVPIPVVGSIAGAFLGSFAGAWIAEATRGAEVGAATRAATGAVIGRTAAVALKIAIGMALSVWILLTVA